MKKNKVQEWSNELLNDDSFNIPKGILETLSSQPPSDMGLYYLQGLEGVSIKLNLRTANYLESLMKVPIQNNQSLKSDLFELLQKSAKLDSSLKWRPNCISFEGNQCNKVGCNPCRSQLPKPISMTNSSSVLSRVAASSKTRIRWTQDLHNQFVECVNRLGGADKATPEEILKIMDASGLTILQVKSHLQVLLFISQLWMFLVY
nr:isoform 2 of myb family transcription factor phl5 [Quercus suber]